MGSVVRTVRATRYVTPLREGGSLPAIVEGDDLGTYVLKFRGAGQGQRALIAELVAGLLGQALGLPVPELVFIDVDPSLGRSEPDGEIQALVLASAGLNIALDYLPGSLGYDPATGSPVDSELASAIVWFDAFMTNVDRTARNPNLLVWHRALYLIDHGAALYFHHDWQGYLDRAASPFTAIRSHVLLPYASRLTDAAERLAAATTMEIIDSAVASIPTDWLGDEPLFETVDAHRAAYRNYLIARLQASAIFTEEARRAHAALI